MVDTSDQEPLPSLAAGSQAGSFDSPYTSSIFCSGVPRFLPRKTLSARWLFFACRAAASLFAGGYCLACTVLDFIGTCMVPQ